MPFIGPYLPYIIAAAAITSAVIGVFNVFSSPKPSTVSFGFQGPLGSSPRYGQFGPLDNTVSNELAIPITYGIVKLAGNIIWQSDPGESVARIVAICEGEIQGISDIRANDLRIETGQDAPGCSVTKYIGTSSQVTDSRLPAIDASGALLAANMNLRNLAYLAVTLVASEQLRGGDPTITSVVCGQLVETWTGNEWTTEKSFSRNPAAIVRDLIINDRYGLGIQKSNIDEAEFGAAYDYCEAIVS